MAEFRLAPAAERDLDQCWHHSRQQWDSGQANPYIDTLLTECARLAESPRAVASCDHIRVGYRRSFVGRHALFFRITDYGIAVIRILHARMDLQRHI